MPLRGAGIPLGDAPPETSDTDRSCPVRARTAARTVRPGLWRPKSVRPRVFHQLRIIGDGVADRVDPGRVTAGSDDDGQQARRGAGGVDRDPDRVGGPIPGDGAAGIVVLRLQVHIGGADVLAVDAGLGQRIDDRLLAVVGLIHRRGDVAGDELDADIRGERVRDALYVAGADDGHLARVVADPFRVMVAGRCRRGETQCEHETNRRFGALADGHAWHPSRG